MLGVFVLGLLKIYIYILYTDLSILQKVDFVPYPFDQESDILKHMALSNAVWIGPTILMQPWPEEESRLKVTIRPFQSTVLTSL